MGLPFADDFERDVQPGADPSPFDRYVPAGTGAVVIGTGYSFRGGSATRGARHSAGDASVRLEEDFTNTAEVWLAFWVRIVSLGTLANEDIAWLLRTQRTASPAVLAGALVNKDAGGVAGLSSYYRHDGDPVITDLTAHPDVALGDELFIEVHYKQAGAPGANDGEFDLYSSGTLYDSVRGIDNDTMGPLNRFVTVITDGIVADFDDVQAAASRIGPPWGIRRRDFTHKRW